MDLRKNQDNMETDFKFIDNNRTPLEGLLREIAYQLKRIADNNDK